jgi:AcrR family transcriptional regulator
MASIESRLRATRRTEGRRTHGRSARVVEEVLKATLEEIGRSGYEALRMEDVASRSGVNKTTIYRRWPTKLDLVSAAMRHLAPPPEPPETGSVRSDLLTLLRELVRRAESPIGRGILRMMSNEGTHPEVGLVKRAVAADHVRTRSLVIERAIERGELPPDTDIDLVVELTFAPVTRRIMHALAAADDDFIEAAVDVVLTGVRGGAARRRAKPRVQGTG